MKYVIEKVTMPSNVGASDYKVKQSVCSVIILKDDAEPYESGKYLSDDIIANISAFRTRVDAIKEAERYIKTHS